MQATGTDSAPATLNTKGKPMLIEFDETRLRDRSRRPSRKNATMARRAQRTAKSARLFLALAFPADLSAFEGAH